MPEDIQLLRSFAETRANDAFSALVDRHISLVYSAALRQLGGAVHRAEDVTQTVFILLARQASSLSRRDDIVGWLYTTTHHSAARLKRSEVRRQRREQEAQMMHELSTAISNNAEWERLRPVIDDAMLELSERDRQAVLLRFFKNEAFAEVGRKLGLSEDAARMRVERALDKLHALLAKRGISSTTAALSVALSGEVMVAAPAGLAASVTSAAMSSGATAIAGAGSLAVIFGFMNASKVTFGLAVAGVTAAGFAVYQLSQAHSVAAEIERTRSDYSALSARRATLDSLLTSAEQEKAQRLAAIEYARARRVAATAADKARQAALEQQREKDEKALEEFLARDPGLMKLRYEANVAKFKAEYAWRIGVPPEKVEELARRYAEKAEANPIGLQSGSTSTPASPNWEARWLAHESVPALLSHLDEPYTPKHAAQFEAILTSAQNHSDPVVAKGLDHNIATFTENQRICSRFDWERVLADTGRIFSPRQMQALQSVAAWGRMAAMREEARKQIAASVQK